MRVYFLLLKRESIPKCSRDINGLERRNATGVADCDVASAPSPEVYDEYDFLVVGGSGIDDDVRSRGCKVIQDLRVERHEFSFQLVVGFGRLTHRSPRSAIRVKTFGPSAEGE